MSIHRQDIECPCCGRIVRGYEPRLNPPFYDGHYHPFRGAFPVAPEENYIWITPYHHKSPEGYYCHGGRNRFYVELES